MSRYRKVGFIVINYLHMRIDHTTPTIPKLSIYNNEEVLVATITTLHNYVA